MKVSKKKAVAAMLSGLLAVSFAFSSPTVKMQAQDTADTGVSEIPGTTRTMIDEDTLNGTFFSVTGFAKGKVNARSQYEEGSEQYAVATNEMEFFEALENAKYGIVKVIELRADLNLGWRALSDEVKEWYGDLIEPYESSLISAKTPVGNPILIETGVSVVTVNNVNGLTIFSTTGNKIQNAEIKFNSKVQDLVIRNLSFSGMWEWDDKTASSFGSTGGTGNRKRTGWSNIKLNGCQNVWIDHCSFGNAFDGNIDIENGSSGITISWCDIGDSDMSKGGIAYKTAMYLEQLYQQNKQDPLVESFAIYKIMRDNGMTPEQIMKFMSQHDKCHLCGAGDKDSWLTKNDPDAAPNYDKMDANERIRMTLAYSKYSDIGQRLPMVRSGIGHLYNCYVDDWDLAEISALLNSDPKGTGKTIVQQIRDAGYECVTLTRAVDARNGASVAADTCVYYGTNGPITGTAYHPNGGNISDGYLNLWKYNYALIVNSSVQKYGSDTVYTGSSWDNNGDNPFIESNTYWDEETKNDHKASEAIIGNWKWRQENNAVSGESLTELPYAYQTFPLEDVKENTEKYSGFRKVEMSSEDWLKVQYEKDYEITPVSQEKEIPLTSLEITQNDVTIFMEEGMKQLLVKALPYNTTQGEDTYEWTSSNPDVATVNDCGQVMPVSCGEARITVTAQNGVSAYCDVTIGQLPTELAITNLPDAVYVGDIIQLQADIQPKGLLDDSVTWSVGSTKLDFTDSGLLHANVSGTFSITATANLIGNRVGAEEVKKKISVKIMEPDVYVSGVSVETEKSVTVGSAAQLHAQVLPENATNQNVIWEVSDSSVAVVNQAGVVTGVAVGETTVTVTTINGGFQAQCKIIVTTGGAIEHEFTFGDMNDDKVVNLADAQIALRCALHLLTPDETQIKAGDVDGDGTIKLADAKKILRVALHLDTFDEKK